MRQSKFIAKISFPMMLFFLASGCRLTTSNPAQQGKTILPATTPALNTTMQPGATETSLVSNNQNIEQRTADLLAQMTLDEKIGQMTLLESNYPAPMAVKALLGGVFAGGDDNPNGANNAENWYSMVDAYQQAALSTRLGIPLLFGIDAVHGDAHLTGTTVFPHNVGLGATRDPALVKQICQVTAAEMNATGVRWTSPPSLPSRRMCAGDAPTRATARTPTLSACSASPASRAFKATN